MKKFKWIIWVVVIAAAGVGIWMWKFKKTSTVLVLSIEHPYYGNISNTVTATGTIQPVDTVAVGTQVSGIIQKVYVDFNSPVKKGQLLAQLDKSLLMAQVNQISANLQSARANVTYQKSNYERQKHLYEVGAISKAEQEIALYQYTSALENVRSIEAQLSSARRNLGYTDIYSPISGTVLSRTISEGQTVAAALSAPTLFSIAKDLTRMQVQAYIDEADIGNVQKGQRVTFTVDAFPTDTFTGKIKDVRLRSSVSANVVSYITIIEAPNPELKLKPGMTASIMVYTKELNNVLLVPAKATNFKPDSVVARQFVVEQPSKMSKAKKKLDSSKVEGIPALVWVKRNNKIVAQPVFTDMNDEAQVQIISGLKLTDEIVTGYTEAKKNSTVTQRSPFMPGPRRQQQRTGAGGGPPH